LTMKNVVIKKLATENVVIESCGNQNLWWLKMCGDQKFDDQILGVTKRSFNRHKVYGNQNKSIWIVRKPISSSPRWCFN
jgi:hypothetical protein